MMLESERVMTEQSRPGGRVGRSMGCAIVLELASLDADVVVNARLNRSAR